MTESIASSSPQDWSTMYQHLGYGAADALENTAQEFPDLQLSNLAPLLAQAGYSAIDLAPALHQHAPQLSQSDMTALLTTAYPGITPDTLGAALTAAGYTSLPGTYQAISVPTGSFLSISPTSAYDIGTGDFTLETWIKPASAGTLIGRKTTDGGPGQGGILLVFQDDRSFKFATDNGFGFYEIHSPPTDSMDGQWHHIAGVRQGGMLSLFFDGQHLASTIRGNGNTPLDVTTSTRLLLGATDQQQETFRFYSGLMDEVRFWNQARSAQDIQATMRQRLDDSHAGLIGCWRAIDGDVQDASPLHNQPNSNGAITFVRPSALETTTTAA